MRNNLTLIGYYGTGNFGDDLMLTCLVDMLRKRFKDLEINIVLDRLGSMKNIKELSKENINIIENKELNKLWRILFYLKIASKSKVICWGGGTCFSDEDGIGGFGLAIIGKILFCKIGYLGIGVGNVNTIINKMKLHIVLRLSNFLIFRDRLSHNEIIRKYTKANFSRFFESKDLSYIFFNENREQYLHKQKNDLNLKSMLICWRNLENFKSRDVREELLVRLINTIEELKQLFTLHSITLLPLDNSIDIPVHNDIKYLLKEKGIASNLKICSSFSSKVKLLSEHDLVISMRLHGAMASVLLGIPTVGISYSPKIEYFFSEIKAENNYLTIKEITSCDHSLLSKVEYVLNNAIADNVENVLQNYATKALKNIDILSQYFQSKRI
jgi:polysaccharide pyruvyl transferase WcaK-like protein